MRRPCFCAVFVALLLAIALGDDSNVHRRRKVIAKLSASKSANNAYEKYDMPYVQRANVTSERQVIEARYHTVDKDFMDVLNKPGWNIIHNEKDVTTIEAIEHNGFWYQRQLAIFKKTPPEIVRDKFRLDQLDCTSKKLDKYYEQINDLQSINTAGAESQIDIIQKTSLRYTLFQKRIWELAYFERKVDHDLTVDFPVNAKVAAHMGRNTSADKFTIPRNVYAHMGLSMGIPDNFVDEAKNLRFVSSYVKAYLDMFSFYVPRADGGTVLFVALRMDMGPDMPTMMVKRAYGIGESSMYKLICILEGKPSRRRRLRGSDSREERVQEQEEEEEREGHSVTSN